MTRDGGTPAAPCGLAAPSSWSVERIGGGAAELHGRLLPDPPRRAVWIHEVDRPALVLGSTQPDDIVDRNAASRAGVEVVRRGSGGGAVLVEPGAVLWIDVVVPPGDALWDDDVGRAADWVGEAWGRALESCGIGDVRPHRGPMVTTRWSRLVCFAGMAPGEVAVGGRKVAGVAQRRTRLGARFSTAALLRWEPERLVSLLRWEAAGDASDALADLPVVAAGVEADPDALVTAFLGGLPDSAPRGVERPGGG